MRSQLPAGEHLLGNEPTSAQLLPHPMPRRSQAPSGENLNRLPATSPSSRASPGGRSSSGTTGGGPSRNPSLTATTPSPPVRRQGGADWVDHVRLHGNAGVHPDLFGDVSLEEAKDVSGLVSHAHRAALRHPGKSRSASGRAEAAAARATRRPATVMCPCERAPGATAYAAVSARRAMTRGRDGESGAASTSDPDIAAALLSWGLKDAESAPLPGMM